MNGDYKLSYESDGVYFETASSFARDNKDDVLAYLERKKIIELNADKLADAIENCPQRVRIAPPQEEYKLGEEALITISSDRMEAEVCLLPPEEGGERLSFERLMIEIESAGVSFGIDENALRLLLENRIYGEKTVFARGVQPQDGKDGWLVFHFNTEGLGVPKLDQKTGRVNFKDLNLFVPVSAGQKLVTRVPATKGVAGYTVTGREISPRPGKEAKMPSGKNVTYDEARLNMYAKTAGRVDFRNQTVTVSSCYNVNGDADLSVGNISFDGDVVVKGNVISDITIQATGNIEVNGTVEGARLIAGGNIVLRRGIQGSGKGLLEAGDGVMAKYIERSEVRAGGNILVDALMHCNAESGDSIIASGKFGSIIGGTIKAQNSITAQNIGSAANNKTIIEVGLSLKKRDRLKYLNSELTRLNAEMEKFEKIINYLTRMENLPPEKEKMKRNVILGKLQNTKLIAEYSKEIELLEEEIKKAERGKVNVIDTIFPGVKLTISLGEFIVTSPIRFSTFYCKNREIEFTSCLA
ncbi:MAG: DUF342 domain-containing protein [Oscillospiraceae bacterium]|jgi:uncharacterized protein (DUF342 family)